MPSSPSTLPLEARKRAWDRLWQRLLAEPPPGDEAEPTDEAAKDPQHDDEAS